MNFQVERLKKLPQRSHERWQGGLFRMPAWVPNENQKLYRPWSAIWLSLATHQMCPPTIEDAVEQKDLTMALNSLVQFACDKTLAGYRPGILEVKDSSLAEYLQGALAEVGIAVECHERLGIFDEALDGLAKHMSGGVLMPGALSAKRVTVDRMRNFADAAAKFYAAKPWRHLCDVDLVKIEAPFIDPLLRCASILGNGGMTYGIGFYESVEMFEQFMAGHGMEAIKKRSYWTLFFGGIEEMPFGDADLWEDNNFPVASPAAYPVAMCYDPEGKHHRPQPDVLAFMEGLLRALSQTSESEIDSGRWQKTVATYDGNETYTLALPDLLESAEEACKRKVKPGRLPDRRAMEKTHLDVQRILDGQDFSSMDEMQNFLNANLVGKKIPPQHPVTALEQAQDICYEAFEARGRKQIQLAKKALEICPDCVDAHVILAEACPDTKESYDLYARGVAAGERLLGTEFFKEEVGHFWGILGTRPYMRARLGMAQALYEMERTEEAITHYQEMLRLNPNDNQGVRENLLACLLETKQTDEAEALLKQYKESGMAVWNYSRALLTFMKKGDSATARKHLANAIKANPFVPEYLLDDEPAPMSPQGYSIGSEEEAAICSELLRNAWEVTPEALDWLEEQLP